MHSKIKSLTISILIIAAGMAIPVPLSSADDDIIVQMIDADDPGLANFHVFENTGIGQFADRGTVGPASTSAGQIQLVDIDGDGDLDLVFNANTRANLAQSFAFDAQSSLPFSNVGSRQPLFADFNGDGLLDLIGLGNLDPGFGGLCDGSETPNLRNTFQLSGNGYGELSFVGCSSDEGVHIAVGDLNGDDWPDLAVVGDIYGTATRTLYWYANAEGVLDLANPREVKPVRGVDINLIDVDGDNDLDVFVAGRLDPQSGATNQLFLNNGSGNFAPDPDFPSEPSGVLNSFVRDVDNDNDEDLILFGNRIHVLINNGSGQFTGHQNGFGTPNSGGISGVGRGAVGDFDGDGDVDLIASNDSQGPWLNDGNGNFVATGAFPTTGIDIVAGDLDRDGAQRSRLRASVLPSARAVEVGRLATAFATILNVGPEDAVGCSVRPPETWTDDFIFQRTDASTNEPVGEASTLVNIASGASQSFVFGLRPTTTLANEFIDLRFVCSGVGRAPSVQGLNQLRLTSAIFEPADMVSIAATLTTPGVVDIPGVEGQATAFSVAAINNGATATITFSGIASETMPAVEISVCETTNLGGSGCDAPRAESVTSVIPSGAVRTYSVFVRNIGNSVDFSPASNRIFAKFTAGSSIVGETSVAARTIQ